LRGELAMDSGAGAPAGSTRQAPAYPPELSIGEVNVEVRIAGVTILWSNGSTLQRASYVPGSTTRAASSSTVSAGSFTN